MIWINNSTEIIEIPKHSSATGNRYKIKLTNNITKKEYEFNVGLSVSDSALMYAFRVNLPAMDDGEYIYELYAIKIVGLEEQSTLIESGLLIYGNYQRSGVSEFEPESNTIVQYNG